jgi:hypothetical protein
MSLRTTAPDQPPPVLDCARVLEYAAVDSSVKYTGRLSIFVDGKALGAVPKLAICQNMGDDPETLLFHCSDDWSVLGAGAYPSVESARDRAEQGYAGISAKWHESPFTLEEAENFLSESWGNSRCAFCGKTPNQVHVLVEGRTGAKICDLCIAELRRAMSEGASSDI